MILATTTVENVDRFLEVFGTKGAEKRAEHGSKGSTVFRDPAEENRVSVLAEVRASKRDGSEYHNLYHFYFEADGRRITGAREYNDTLYASQAFA